MHDFQKLRVWQLSRDLAVAVGSVCRSFPRSDHGILSSQLRRASLSIPANIAEGCGKSSRRETLRFLEIASGSAFELQSHLQVAADLGYLSPIRRDELTARTCSVQRMLRKLTETLP